MKASWSQWRNRWAAFAHDFLSIPIAWLGAYWLRFNLDEIPADILTQAFATLPWVMLFQVLGFWIFGLYRGVWRFASIPDLIRIVKAICMGSLMALLAVFLISRMEHLPRSVPMLYSMLLLLMLGGSRFIYRWSKDKRYFAKKGQRVLVVGAGRAGESLVRDLLRDNHTSYNPVAFVDDDKQKLGRELHGIRVVGSCQAISHIVNEFGIEMILIAVPSAKASDMRRIAMICESTNIPVRTLPGTNDLVSGSVSVKNLREISLEDLLGRDPVKLDWDAITTGLKDKVILISGGGGSIGSELCRQLIKINPKQLIIVDNSEYNLFCIQQELAEKLTYLDNVAIDYLLVDLCDEKAIDHLIRKMKPQVVFHAAAYKHVPLLEPQIRAAAKNNVVGTYYLSAACVLNHVEKFVLVSSDKAVNPTNVMGATKRVSELVCQYFNIFSKTRFITVRFGNVLGSKGSVVETFTRQLEHHGPITVTHPEVVRYFMTIQEASQLILQAMSIGEGGELFVLDMGEPVKIRFLAEQMIRLGGNKLGDIKIEYIGLRPGEKLFEELFHKREQLVPTTHSKILKAHPRKIDRNLFEHQFKALCLAIEKCVDEEIYMYINEMVPELLRDKNFQPLPKKQVQRDESTV